MYEYVRQVLAGRRDEGGASSAEYGLLISGVAALIVGVVFLFGTMLTNSFSHTCTTIHDTTAVGHCS